MRDVMAVDPVCHMPLDERRVKESLIYGGREYRFCSVGCRAEFERYPEDYTYGAQLEDGVNDNV
jgi:YHS domain-containing protein